MTRICCSKRRSMLNQILVQEWGTSELDHASQLKRFKVLKEYTGIFRLLGHTSPYRRFLSRIHPSSTQSAQRRHACPLFPKKILCTMRCSFPFREKCWVESEEVICTFFEILLISTSSSNTHQECAPTRLKRSAVASKADVAGMVYLGNSQFPNHVVLPLGLLHRTTAYVLGGVDVHP